MGLFLGAEPLYDELQGVSPYSYGLNNPAKFVDKDGNNPIPFVAAGVSAGVYIAGAAVAALAVHSVSYATNAEYRKAVNAGSASAAGAVSKAVDNAVSNIKELANQVWSAQQEELPEKTVEISKSKYPESAQHIEEAQSDGKPSVITIDRAGASSRRKEALNGESRKSGKDRDEYPPAVSKEGGKGASVKKISSSDNRGAGATMGNQLKNVKDGSKVEIKVVD